MNEVTKEEFWNVINTAKFDIVTHVENEYSYPFTSIFETRSRQLVGKIVDSYPENGNKWPVTSTYFLA